MDVETLLCKKLKKKNKKKNKKHKDTDTQNVDKMKTSTSQVHKQLLLDKRKKRNKKRNEIPNNFEDRHHLEPNSTDVSQLAKCKLCDSSFTNTKSLVSVSTSAENQLDHDHYCHNVTSMNKLKKKKRKKRNETSESEIFKKSSPFLQTPETESKPEKYVDDAGELDIHGDYLSIPENTEVSTNEVDQHTSSDNLFHSSKSLSEHYTERKEWRIKNQCRTGHFSPQETAQLKENWKTIFTKNPFPKPYDIMCCPHSASKDYKQEVSHFRRKTSFYTALAFGINRSVYDVYKKGRCIFDPNYSENTISNEQGAKLMELWKIHGKKPYSFYAEIMKLEKARLRKYIFYRKEGMKTGHWSHKENQELLQTIQDMTKKREIGDMFHGLPWTSIAKQIPSRNHTQCRKHWNNLVGNFSQKKASVSEENDIKRWNSTDKMLLLDSLNGLVVSDECDIDWYFLLQNFPHVASPQSLQEKFYRMKVKVPDYPWKSLGEILDYMYEHYYSQWEEATKKKKAKLEAKEEKMNQERKENATTSANDNAPENIDLAMVDAILEDLIKDISSDEED